MLLLFGILVIISSMIRGDPGKTHMLRESVEKIYKYLINRTLLIINQSYVSQTLETDIKNKN